MKVQLFSTLSLALGITLSTATMASASATLNAGGLIFGNPGAASLGTLTPVESFSGTFSGSTTNSQFSGTYSIVIDADSLNPYCAGCYDFIINLSSNASSTDDIESISDGAFTMSQVTVGVQPGAGNNPTYISRSSDGTTIDYNYSGANNVAGGESINEIVIETNSKTFSAGSIVIADDVQSTDAGFGDVGAPEPITMSLLGGGLAALGLLRWRSKSRKN